MSLPDPAADIAARRRLGRQLTFWRISAVVIALIAIAAVVGSADGISRFSPHIARVRLTGFISGDQKTLDLFKALKDDGEVQAVVLHVDSPGGSTVGAEAVFEAVRGIAEKKPVVAVMDTLAASGGYAAAIAADHVVARGNTLTGSIGVIFQWPEFSGLLDKLGVKVDTLKSGELKAEPSPFAPPSDKVRQVSQAMVMDSYDWFTGIVAERRKLTPERTRELADGRVYTGRQALANGLIDEIGGEDKAIAWLEDKRGVTKDLKVIDREPARKATARLFSLGSAAAALMSGDIPGAIAALSEKALAGQSLMLDGLVSVWQPERLE